MKTGSGLRLNWKLELENYRFFCAKKTGHRDVERTRIARRLENEIIYN